MVVPELGIAYRCPYSTGSTITTPETGAPVSMSIASHRTLQPYTSGNDGMVEIRSTTPSGYLERPGIVPHAACAAGVRGWQTDNREVVKCAGQVEIDTAVSVR